MLLFFYSVTFTFTVAFMFTYFPHVLFVCDLSLKILGWVDRWIGREGGKEGRREGGKEGRKKVGR